MSENGADHPALTGAATGRAADMLRASPLARILPGGVTFAESFTDVETGDLFPEEEAVIDGAVDKRRREFTTGRWLARRAMAAAGQQPVAITRGGRGQPVWPTGLVGAITHCAGYRAAAVGPARSIAGLGIDAEPNQPLPPRTLSLVALPSERRDLEELSASNPDVSWDRLVFTIKETIYKAWFPMTRQWLDFHQARVHIRAHRADEGTFEGGVLSDIPQVAGLGRFRHLTGRWTVSNGLVVSAMVLPRPRPDALS